MLFLSFLFTLYVDLSIYHLLNFSEAEFACFLKSIHDIFLKLYCKRSIPFTESGSKINIQNSCICSAKHINIYDNV